MYKFKKILSLLIISVIWLTATVGTVPFDISAETITTAYIEGTDVRVRNTPSTASSSSIIEKISNTSATVLSSVKNAEGTWYQITYYNGTTQITGYIFYDSSYIRIVKYNPDAAFEEKIKAFPSSYQTALKSLHAAYPNWEFVPEPISLSFSQAVALQTENMRKQVEVSSGNESWRSMGAGSYDWSKGAWAQSNGGWTGASREVIAYYMDPRNFFNVSGIFQFMKQTYTAQTTEADVNEVIKGTFMEKGYKTFDGDAYGGSYAKLFLAAGKEAGIDPCVLVAAIIQEQGTCIDKNGNVALTPLISGTYKGYEGYYNFLNISASGANTTAVIVNGLEKAKKEGWNSIPESIKGGAKFYKEKYINRYNNATKNQDTYYYQDFNVQNTNEIWHQYAQAIHDANSKGSFLNKCYQSDSKYALTFRIPVYTDMPSAASPLPAKNSNKNNYYFSNISNVTPTFSMFTYSYSLHVAGDTSITATPVSGASYDGYKSFSLKEGNNTVTLKVKSETGYITNYVISVTATKDCTLTVNGGGGSTAPSTQGSTVKKGDTNGDGSITIRDLANVRLHLLGITLLKGNNLTGADTNKDGKVTIRDLANVRLHLLAITKLN